MNSMEEKIANKIIEKLDIDKILDKIDIDKLIERIAEKVAEKIINEEKSEPISITYPENPLGIPARPIPPYGIATAYGCQPITYTDKIVSDTNSSNTL